jgi:hypothetical protein
VSAPHRIGSWVCPSGNSVDVDLVVLGESVARLDFAWDDPPPLLPDDARFYRVVILPAVTRRVAEYTERVGRTLTVTL